MHLAKRKKNEHVVPKNIYSAWQTTQSLYTQQNIELFSKTNLGLGLRLQKNLIGITDILNVNEVDGVLIGGASLNPKDFLAIYHSTVKHLNLSFLNN